ncbi:MAG: hypothetical protein DRP57_08585 [Spirochaetes bacterium]|nr:MAG: hypothetical protein DRP57_08585 [Spirochaetota bacterium]
MEKNNDNKPVIYPANKNLIDKTILVDDMPSVKLFGKRIADGKTGWFYFSPIIGSYHAVVPDWVKGGDEVEFFEKNKKGELLSLKLPDVKIASGSVTRLFLEDGNILLFSNIAGVHQTFHLVKPKELKGIKEIAVDLVYIEEKCPKCGSLNVFHYNARERSFSKCLNCGHAWQGEIRSNLIFIKEREEEEIALEVDKHPKLKELLLKIKNKN